MYNVAWVIKATFEYVASVCYARYDFTRGEDGSSELEQFYIRLPRDTPLGWITMSDCDCVKLVPDLHPDWSKALEEFGKQCFKFKSSPLEQQSVLPWAVKFVSRGPENAYGNAQLQKWLLREDSALQRPNGKKTGNKGREKAGVTIDGNRSDQAAEPRATSLAL
ncbi:hypothetical protein QFC22_003979 [Naganishia vaughanmartiniae]|uniref:Uncharacterized protein n=1 Tax=Naganishia vaughanmartiniae TaxID=1424756 RepID=A0ACC2X4W0_9TREE|nr:hypothetical protein QFC22_003979 [Naganishia vaughanmartiniae]